jgi:hypothetical protein
MNRYSTIYRIPRYSQKSRPSKTFGNISLPAGTSAVLEFRLDELFDLTIPGVYTADVNFMIANENKSGADRYIVDTKLHSNEVSFTVEDHPRINPNIEQLSKAEGLPSTRP